MLERWLAAAIRAVNGRAAAMPPVLLLGILISSPVHSASPAEEIRDAIDKVVAILEDSKLKAPAQRQARLEQLRRVMYPKFDFTEMARRSLGSHWQKRSAQEQREFVQLFTQLMENAYMKNLEAYDGEKVAIIGEQEDRDYAEVRSRITAKEGREHSVDYKLKRDDAGWKVYDVVIENISLVNNYRSQFNRVVAQSSFEELMRRLRSKQKI